MNSHDQNYETPAKETKNDYAALGDEYRASKYLQTNWSILQNITKDATFTPQIGSELIHQRSFGKKNSQQNR